MGRWDDELDLRMLDGASKVAFGVVDVRRRFVAWWRQSIAKVRAMQVTKPELVENVAIIAFAALVEVLVAWFGRRR